MYFDFKKKLELLPKIKEMFFVNDVEFKVKKSYLSISKGVYTRHLIENVKSGKQAIVKHEKIKDYL